MIRLRVRILRCGIHPVGMCLSIGKHEWPALMVADLESREVAASNYVWGCKQACLAMSSLSILATNLRSI